MRKKWRTEMTKGIWYYGNTGVGKSHKALEGYNEDEVYIVPNDNGWWDDYRQQRKVVLNDFRGEISYNQMLQLVDKWPYHVRRRGKVPIPFTSEEVVITSSLPPWEVYNRRATEDNIGQLLRRFKVYEVKEDSCTEVQGGNNVLPVSLEINWMI